jgi:hypothetical protein
LLTFLYPDSEMIVKVFYKTSYRVHYHTDDSGENTANNTVIVFFLCSVYAWAPAN